MEKNCIITVYHSEVIIDQDPRTFVQQLHHLEVGSGNPLIDQRKQMIKHLINYMEGKYK